MHRSPAERRYLKRFAPTMVAYVVALFGANWVAAAWHPTGPLLVLLAILPALPILALIGVMGLYIVEETDEYQRQRAVSTMLVALAVTLSLATVWGFLEDAGVAQHVPGYWAFAIWCGVWGVAQCVSKLRDRAMGEGR